MINFSSVVIKDFLNIKHREVRLDTPGLTLVVGKNGTGKSAQYSESLAWALFGQTIRPLTADEVIRKDQPSCKVAVLLNVEGQEYVVERKKSPTRRFPASTQRPPPSMIASKRPSKSRPSASLRPAR